MRIILRKQICFYILYTRAKTSFTNTKPYKDCNKITHEIYFIIISKSFLPFITLSIVCFVCLPHVIASEEVVYAMMINGMNKFTSQRNNKRVVLEHNEWRIKNYWLSYWQFVTTEQTTVSDDSPIYFSVKHMIYTK